MRFEAEIRPPGRPLAAPRVLAVSQRSAKMLQRALSLGRAGFEVTGVLGVRNARLALARNSFDVVILGNAIPLPQRLSLIGTVRRRQPAARILVVGRSDARVDACLDPHAGNDELLHAVALLLHSG